MLLHRLWIVGNDGSNENLQPEDNVLNSTRGVSSEAAAKDEQIEKRDSPRR